MERLESPRAKGFSVKKIPDITHLFFIQSPPFEKKCDYSQHLCRVPIKKIEANKMQKNGFRKFFN